MSHHSMSTSPNTLFAGDTTEVLTYRRDPHNYLTQLFAEQLPVIPTGLFNIHMSQGVIIQPHWHTNVSETLLVVNGGMLTSLFNPHTRQLISYRLKTGQAAVFPKGWFHWITATMDHTHLIAIFDGPTPDIVYGSDFLRFVPGEVMERAYGVNANSYTKTVAPIQQSVVFGPPLTS